MIITRKIEIYIDDKENRKEIEKNLHQWRFICMKSANMLSSHLFVMDNMKNMVYLDEDIKLKLTNKEKDPDGILNTSYQNSGYKMLSNQFKGQIPTEILTNLCQNVNKNYKAEKKEIYVGSKSLRSYKSSIPIPIKFSDVKLNKVENSKNFTFKKFGIPFATRLGRDGSDNETILDRLARGEYKASISSIVYQKAKQSLQQSINQTNKKNSPKWFLLLCVDIPESKPKLREDIKVRAGLSLLVPIIASCNGKEIEIGSNDEYLYGRIRIQSKIKDLQKELKYAKGNSRKNKLSAIDRFSEKEKNYVKTKIHMYSRHLVNYALKNKASEIILVSYKDTGKLLKENKDLLRNWNYFGIGDYIKYKAKKFGINVVEEESIIEKIS